MALELYRRKDEPNLGQVGDIKSSVLTEAQFQAMHGSTWTLMDGKDVTGSNYAVITGNTLLPDSRGIFLRGKNNGRAANEGNPDGDVAVGTGQDDAMQGHFHNMGTSVNIYATGGANQTIARVGVTNTGTSADHIKDPISDGVNGTPKTDEETRPKNITVNYFVKID